MTHKIPTRKGDFKFLDNGKSVGAQPVTENATGQRTRTSVWCPFPEGEEYEGWPTEFVALVDHDFAIECLRDIAAMGKKAGSETAKNWLLSHGYALEEGGYIPGKGYECGVDV